MSQTEVKNKIRPMEGLKEPGRFKVIYLNDNTTTMEFVVESLVEFFDYSISAAHQITVDIHEEGSATVAVLPFEIAEQKGHEITQLARTNGYPLQIRLEPEEVST